LSIGGRPRMRGCACCLRERTKTFIGLSLSICRFRADLVRVRR
jgi:hypothetical protein